VTNDNAPAVAEICHRLDGIPLAIELAAARTRILTPQQICDGLPDRFRLLVGGSRTATHRQQTLQASVDWSYQLLDDDERTLLHRMSVFAGAITLDAVEGVCDGHGLERLAILDVLTGLIDKSLVVVDDDGPAARYRLLETIRQYADVRLAESGDKDRVSARHRDYFLALAEHIEPHLFGVDQDQATTELLDAQPDLAAAFDWSDNHGDTEAMLRFVCATFYYFIVRGMVAQGRTWAETSLAPGDGDPRLRARALVADGQLAIFGSDYTSATRAAAAAMEIAPPDEATRLRAEGLAAEVTALGDPAAIPGLAANLVAAQARHDLWWLSEGTCNLHFAHLIAGNLVEARSAIDEALAVTAVTQDPFEQRQALGATAFLAALQGDLTSAIDLAEPIIEAARSNHDTMMLTLGLAALALAKTHRGEYEYAQTIADEAVEICLETACVFTPGALLASGNLAFCEGDFQTMHATEKALRPVGEAANTPYAERYRSLLSLAYTLNGNTDLGRQTLANADQTTSNYHAMQYLWAQAILERAEGDLVEAEATAHRCLSICRTMKVATVEVETIEVLAGLAADVESHDVAARLLGAADARRHALGYVRPPIMRPSHDSDVATLIDAIGSERYKRVLAEGTAMSWDEALDYVTRGRGQRKRPSTGWASLTPAELAVVNVVADGMSNQQVADRLFISPRTVGTHLTHVFAKLGVTSRAELTATALRRAR
jgi:DNA-binding CsgD family transcriptional regulator/tetratricopeptide (TPR) repeat protein